MCHDRVEQRPQVAAPEPWIVGCDPGTRIRIQHRELDLVLRGIEVDEQVVYLVEHFLRACIRSIDLVENHDGRQAA